MLNKLAELLEEAEGLVNNDRPSLEQIADYLIANGVTIPVRCRDCTMKGDEEECPLLSMAQYTEDMDFCSYGERRTDEVH